MPGYNQVYNRNTKEPKFYSTAVGSEGYNPEITVYYDSDNNVVRVKESWRGETWARTISGSNYAQNWPSYTHYEVISAWATVSG